MGLFGKTKLSKEEKAARDAEELQNFWRKNPSQLQYMDKEKATETADKYNIDMQAVNQPETFGTTDGDNDLSNLQSSGKPYKEKRGRFGKASQKAPTAPQNTHRLDDLASDQTSGNSLFGENMDTSGVDFGNSLGNTATDRDPSPFANTDDSQLEPTPKKADRAKSRAAVNNTQIPEPEPDSFLNFVDRTDQLDLQHNQGMDEAPVTETTPDSENASPADTVNDFDYPADAQAETPDLPVTHEMLQASPEPIGAVVADPSMPGGSPLDYGMPKTIAADIPKAVPLPKTAAAENSAPVDAGSRLADLVKLDKETRLITHTWDEVKAGGVIAKYPKYIQLVTALPIQESVDTVFEQVFDSMADAQLVAAYDTESLLNSLHMNFTDKATLLRVKQQVDEGALNLSTLFTKINTLQATMLSAYSGQALNLNYLEHEFLVDSTALIAEIPDMVLTPNYRRELKLFHSLYTLTLLYPTYVLRYPRELSQRNSADFQEYISTLAVILIAALR